MTPEISKAVAALVQSIADRWYWALLFSLGIGAIRTAIGTRVRMK